MKLFILFIKNGFKFCEVCRCLKQLSLALKEAILALIRRFKGSKHFNSAGFGRPWQVQDNGHRRRR